MSAFFQLLLAFFTALPDLIKLVQAIQTRNNEAGVQTKVAEDVKTIHEAFSAKDPAKLNALFNS